MKIKILILTYNDRNHGETFNDLIKVYKTRVGNKTIKRDYNKFLTEFKQTLSEEGKDDDYIDQAYIFDYDVFDYDIK